MHVDKILNTQFQNSSFCSGGQIETKIKPVYSQSDVVQINTHAAAELQDINKKRQEKLQQYRSRISTLKASAKHDRDTLLDAHSENDREILKADAAREKAREEVQHHITRVACQKACDKTHVPK